MAPDVRLLRALVALDAERHFGRAAQRVHVSQPALSRQIAQLEREIGAPLFRRTSRSVEPTPAGRRLAQRAADALGAIDAAVEEARTGDARPAVVRLGVTETVGDAPLGRLLSVLAEDDSSRLVVHPGWSSSLIDALCRGSLDLVLGHALAVPEALASEVLALDALVACMAEGHPLAAERDSVALEDLAGRALLVPEPSLSPGLHDHLVACCRTRGFEPRTATPTLQVPPALGSATTGLDAATFALVPESLPRREGTVTRPLRDAPSIPLVLAWCPGVSRGEVDALAEALRRTTGPAPTRSAARG